MELTPAQRQQVEAMINSSVLSGSGELGSGQYEMGVNNPETMGTGLTSRSVKTTGVNEYGYPILDNAKASGLSVVAPNQPAGSINTDKNEERLKTAPLELPPDPRIAMMANKYGWKGSGPSDTKIDEQLMLSQWRKNNPIRSAPYGTNMVGIPVDDVSFVRPGQRKAAVADPWTKMRMPGQAAPVAAARGGFSLPFGLSLGSGGPSSIGTGPGQAMVVDPNSSSGSTLSSMGFSSGSVIPSATMDSLRDRGYL